MAYQKSVTTFQPLERFEPKVLPPTEDDNAFALMIHYGAKDMVGLRMTKGQLISVYTAIESALKGVEETNLLESGVSGQQSMFNGAAR